MYQGAATAAPFLLRWFVLVVGKEITQVTVSYVHLALNHQRRHAVTLEWKPA
nr:hypothetical protein [uncultured Halomonas sp.]